MQLVDPLRDDAELRHLASSVRAPGAAEPFGAYMFRHDEPGAE